LEEANNNSQALSAIADEIASAKNDTDFVIDGLVANQDRIYAEIQAREEAFDTMYANLDQLRYMAETETNPAFVDARWLQYDAAEAAINEAHNDNEDAWRLIDEYEYNIRQVRNSFRVTKAKLVAERTNAELMVAIKQRMNMEEDLTGLNEANGRLQTKIDASDVQADIDAWTAE